MLPAGTGWHVETVTASVGRLHADAGSVGASRRARVCRATNTGLVISTGQTEEAVDRAAAEARGVEVVRRRSGGGAVLVRPGDLVWVDVAVPASDPLWEADVGRAFWWLGEAWAVALETLGVRGAEVHRHGLVGGVWGRRVCFAGTGPGEVTVDGRKVVGLCQRRARSGALFQCAALLVWDPRALLDLLALDEGERQRGAERLAEAAAGLVEVGAAVEAAGTAGTAEAAEAAEAAVVTAFLAALP